jgi:hypothetical protein
MQEVWKAIPGYEGLYEVSDQGRVRNAKRHVLAPNKMTNGYLCVHLYANGKHTRAPKTIHRLVARVFLTKPKNAIEVNHKNFDRTDNRAENLEWVSAIENVRHTIAAGRNHKSVVPVKGIRVSDGVAVSFESQVAAEEALRGKRTGGVSHAIKLNRSMYGYKWMRV